MLTRIDNIILQQIAVGGRLINLLRNADQADVDYKHFRERTKVLEARGEILALRQGQGIPVVLTRADPFNKENHMSIPFGFDPGASAVKAEWRGGQINITSAVSVNGQRELHGLGLKTRKRPQRIVTGDGEFWVGAGAHDFGRPVENLDFDRLSGSPEMRALFYATLSKTLPVEHRSPLRLVVGLPIGALEGEEGKATLKAVKAFLFGPHDWGVDGIDRTATVERVDVTAQPVGALFEFFLDDHGRPRPEHASAYRDEIAIISVGMATVELLTTRGGQPVERFTGGDAIGMQRLLAMLNTDGTYSLAEMDEQMRAGVLQTNGQTAVWAREVGGFIDKVWGKARKRFARIILTGGGVYHLRDFLLRKFGAKVYIAADPVQATATGLYRYGLMQQNKERKEANATG